MRSLPEAGVPADSVVTVPLGSGALFTPWRACSKRELAELQALLPNDGGFTADGAPNRLGYTRKTCKRTVGTFDLTALAGLRIMSG